MTSSRGRTDNQVSTDVGFAQVSGPDALHRRSSLFATDPPRQRAVLAWRVVAAIVLAQAALHLYVVATTEFGVHRDEFLYFAMGRHLRLWQMDFPPLIAVLANASRSVFSDSLFAVRVMPALVGAAIIVCASLICRELSGGRWAQAFTALAVATAPLFLRASTLFQPVVLDQLWWSMALLGLIRVGATDGTRGWPLIGLALGLGLLTKFSIAFVALPIVATVLLTRWRAMLVSPQAWIAAAIALIVGSPSLVGQVRLGFPVAGQMSDLRTTQLAHVTASSFVLEQPLLIGLVPCAIALLGGLALLRWRRFRSYRGVGITIGVAFTLLLVTRGKPYYAGPIYPTLIAAGATRLESLNRTRSVTLLLIGTTAMTLLLSAIALPLAVPMLSPANTARYAAALGARSAVSTNRGEMDRLPQDFADMLGWEAQAKALRTAFLSLSPEERREAVIIAGNYGEAGAAEFYRERYGLPPVVSPAGSFWFFGPGERAGRVAIGLGASKRDLAAAYRDIRTAVRIASPWSVAEEREVDVVLARQPVASLRTLWPGWKRQ